MAILNGITFKETGETHQLDYDKAIANKPKLVKSYNDLEDKPFYEKEVKVPFFEKQTYELINKSTDVDSYYINDILIDLEVGKKYYVYFDDVEYECDAFEYVDTSDDESVSLVILGNGALSDPSKFDNTGEPFVYARFIGYSISTFATETQGTHTLEIKVMGTEIVHIPTKYIKDMYGKETSICEFYNGNVECSFDGEVYGGYVYLNKKQYDQWQGDWNTATVIWDGVEYQTIAKDFMGIKTLGNVTTEEYQTPTDEPFVIMVAQEDEMYVFVVMSNDIPEDETNAQPIAHNLSISFEEEKINYIPPEYIKDMYSSETKQNIIFEEQDVQFVAMSEGGLQGYGYIHQPPIGINGNLDCIVEWDGVGYRCTPIVDSDTEESREIYVGNLGFIGGDDTGEPFLILDNLQMTVFATTAEGTHKVCVYQNEEVVHQIPSKYVDSYTKTQIDEMFGAYVDEVNTLLGGED